MQERHQLPSASTDLATSHPVPPQLQQEPPAAQLLLTGCGFSTAEFGDPSDAENPSLLGLAQLNSSHGKDLRKQPNSSIMSSPKTSRSKMQSQKGKIYREHAFNQHAIERSQLTCAEMAFAFAWAEGSGGWG